MSGEDQPEDQPEDPLADPKRRQEAFARAKKAQEQILSPQFGGHAHVSGTDAGQGGTKSRIQQFVDEAVERTSGQIDRVVDVMREIASEIVVSPGETWSPETVASAGQAQTWTEAEQPRQFQPAAFEAPANDSQPVTHQASWSMDAAPLGPRDREQWEMPEAGHGFSESPQTASQPPIAALQSMAPPERIERFSTGRMNFGGDQENPVIQQEPAPRMSTIVDKPPQPEWPADWGKPFSSGGHAFSPEPGADSASQPFTGSQRVQQEQMLDLGGAIDDFGMEMAEFAETVTDTIRTLTRRVNDMHRALQGEGSDFT